jgi:hypothetical protein
VSTCSNLCVAEGCVLYEIQTDQINAPKYLLNRSINTSEEYLHFIRCITKKDSRKPKEETSLGIRSGRLSRVTGGWFFPCPQS